MKRSNRLFLLLGIVLAVVAAAGVLLLGNSGGGPGQGQVTPPPAEIDVVTAAVDIPLGKLIAPEDLATRKAPVASLPADVITSNAAAEGRTARRAIRTGEVLTSSMFQTTGNILGSQIQDALEQGFRAVAVQVDQVTGVGTVIQAGDRVDVLIAFEDTDNKLPVVVEGAPTREGTPLTTVRNFRTVDDLLNNTSVKVLVQNAQVLGTLLPPPPAEQGQQGAASPAPGGQEPTTALTGQQQIVILGVTPQQVELVRFAQLDGNLSLVLRSRKDDASPPDSTTGITLRELVDRWGVLPPRVIVTEVP